MLRDLVLLLVVILGLVAGSQVPSFVDAYTQRLGGAADELGRVVAGYRAAAAGQDLSFEDYMTRHRGNTDPAIRATGGAIDWTVARLDTLEQARTALIQAGAWGRPGVAVLYADREILAAAYDEWRPGLAIEPRWGGVGALLAWLLHMAVSGLVSGGFGSRRHRPVHRRRG